MKASLVTSTVLHVGVLCFALLTFGAPKTLDVADVEALPVDIVPVEALTHVQKGDKKAPKRTHPAPKPTERPDIVKNAQEIGNNKVDLQGPSGKASEHEVKAAAPPKSEKTTPKIDDNPTPATKAEETPTPKPAPPSEVASLPKPAPPAKATPKPAAKADQPAPKMQASQPSPPPTPDATAPEFASLPAAGPVPDFRPEPPQPKPDKRDQKKADEQKPEPKKKPEDKPVEKPAATAKAAAPKKNDFNADQIAALLNREQTAGGGAKRSTEQAALGANRTIGSQKLSQSEMDALRGQIEKNWNIIPGTADGQNIRIQVTMRLDPSGAIIGNPQVTATGGSDQARRTLQGSALRAVLMASPFQGLPRDKYNAWSEVVVNFDPSQLD